MPDAVWVLNAMYEQEQGSADLSYHEHHQPLGWETPAMRLRELMTPQG
ncbi:hypothetical protein [Streptomyces sp. NPDC005244]